MLQGPGDRVVFRDPQGDKLSYVLQIHLKATNNVGENEAPLHGLHIAKELGIQRVLCYRHSDLVAQQTRGTWDTKNATIFHKHRKSQTLKQDKYKGGHL